MTDFLPLPENVQIAVGSSRTEQARVLKAQFGNNYAQRAGDGLNSLDKSYSVSFEFLTHEEKDVIVNFLRACGGWKAFYYTSPDDGITRMWTCEKWDVRHVSPIHDTVACTFTEVFTP